ncbi:hypothetical protein PV396_14690 [Streptomyces sp. ME02-8801-2C]|uniref:hypothetical protein n=1 Tax=Streptomyces sp. ME02-8801-2C TaxID=3028680 RepID=UPI0029B3662B|nr:hypothetical protein [Streptomyces sp. ME02-8801-2C]MDX3453184.1 hypothetical protein [Streptomyces sp. ME02-8801-2C]
MRRLIRRFSDWAQTLLTPAGHHHAVCLPPPGPLQALQIPQPRIAIAETVRAWYEPLDGTANKLVRPYLAAYEFEERASRRRLLGDDSWHATYYAASNPQGIRSQLGAA